MAYNIPKTLPAQSGNTDKVLSTDGSSTTWQYAGLGAGSLGTNNVVLGRSKPSSLSGTGNIICGPSAGNALGNSVDALLIGNNAYKSNTTAGTYSYALVIGNNAGQNLTGSEACVVIGNYAASNLTNANLWANTIIGNYAGQGSAGLSVGYYNTIIGHQAGQSYLGTNSTKIGMNCGQLTSGTDNTFVGYGAGAGSATPSSGAYNSSLGSGSLKFVTSGGNNCALGYNSGSALTSGSGNIFLGYSSGKYSTTQGNELFIDNQDRTNYATQQTNSLIYGVFNATPASQTLTCNAAVTATYGLAISTAGKGLTVKSGSNAKIGVTGAFPGGNPNTVTVSNTSVTSNSIILVSPMSFTGGLTSAPYVSAITASTSFVITVPDNSFTGTVGWVIVEQS